MKFRKFKKSDTKEVARIKTDVFKSCNQNEYFDKRAVYKYLERTDPKRSEAELFKIFNFSSLPIFYVAEDDKTGLLGYIAGNKNRIVNLFVEQNDHKKGIGKKLVELFEKEAKKQGAKEIRLRSSLFAVRFYEKMGYKKTTGVRNLRGLKVQPMKKSLVF